MSTTTEFSVKELAETLRVSRSGYYAWVGRQEHAGPRARQNAVLMAHIRSMHQEHQERYGSPRIYQALRQRGVRCGHNRVARLMRQEGLRAKAKRPFRPRTTQPGSKPAPNLLAKVPPPKAPNAIWVADITYIRTGEGWLYLAAVMDLYSRRIVGWHAADHLRSELAEQALQEALHLRRPARSWMHHSDQGFQYSSLAYQELLRSHQAVRSMSRKGECYDNAAMESFWSSLKGELLEEQLPSRKAAIQALFEYIEMYYNRRRLHSSLGYESPVDFEKRWAAKKNRR